MEVSVKVLSSVLNTDKEGRKEVREGEERKKEKRREEESKGKG